MDNLTVHTTASANTTAKGDTLSIAEMDENLNDIATAIAALEGASSFNNLVEDTTPQLGGSLDVNGNSIISTSNADIVVTPDGTGVISVLGTTDYETNVTHDDDIPNKKYVDDAITAGGGGGGSFTAPTLTLTNDATNGEFYENYENVNLTLGGDVAYLEFECLGYKYTVSPASDLQDFFDTTYPDVAHYYYGFLVTDNPAGDTLGECGCVPQNNRFYTSDLTARVVDSNAGGANDTYVLGRITAHGPAGVDSKFFWRKVVAF